MSEHKVYGFSRDAFINTLLAYNKFIVAKTCDLTIDNLEDEEALDTLIADWTEEFFEEAERTLVVDIDDIMTSINEKLVKNTGDDLYEHADVMLKEIN